MRFLSIATFAGLAAVTHVAASTLEARTTCPAGQAWTSGRCRDCGPGQFSIGGYTQCQTCPSGSTSNAGSSYCVCNPGFYINGGKTTANACNACSAGYTSSQGSSGCSPCGQNTFSTAGGTCQACPAGYTSPPASSSCTRVCNAGTYLNNAARTAPPEPPLALALRPAPQTTAPAGKYTINGGCANCPAGTFSGPNAPSCTDCPPGAISNPGSSSCTPCPGGAVPAANAQSCSTCPRDTFSNGDNCSPCPAGSTSNPGSSSCGPQPSRRALADPALCPIPGQVRCPIWHGVGGTDCVNPRTAEDSCGGCVAPEGFEGEEFTGIDCTAIPNVRRVGCNAGKCKIFSCIPGYEPMDGSCVPTHASRKRSTRF
ncbi:hypothetical protein BKA70DRAFT_1431928 [Coprinopsis sp. MPI-PUGE-AT-0042]|nr:hypothetical protein BKA70DRAFT_1431928 [Coprinopsis sp. MPI-PUGE-AT-0042]